MEFKKCERCGNFFMSSNKVCCNCESKDNFEMNKLKNYLEQNSEFLDKGQICMQTGITEKNLNRYLSNGDFTAINKV